MSGTKRGSGSASARTVFDRTVTEAVRQSKRLAQHDSSFVPPGDDASVMIAAQMFGGSTGGTAGISGRTLTFDTHLQKGDPSYDGSADADLKTDATPLNTASTIVARDASGKIAIGELDTTKINSTGDIGAPGNTGTFLHLVTGDVGATGNIASGDTVSAVHASFGDLGVTSTATVGDLISHSDVTAASGTGSFLHLVSGDLDVPTLATSAITGHSGATAIAVGPRIDTAASTAARAGLRLPAGVAPTTPADGEVWYDGFHFFGRANGVTKQLDN